MRASSAKSVRCIFGGAALIMPSRDSRESSRPSAKAPTAITREAYSHEVISHGWWPGNKDMEAAFYSYTAPEPAGLPDTINQGKIRPASDFLQFRDEEFLSLLRRREEIRLTRTDPHGLLPNHLRSRRQPRQLGPRCIGTQVTVFYAYLLEFLFYFRFCRPKNRTTG